MAQTDPAFAMNKATPAKPPLQTHENRLQNVAKNLDEQGEGSSENALVEALEGLFEKTLAETMAEELENAGEGEGVKNTECRAQDPSKCHTHGTPKYTPEQKKRIDDYKAATDANALAWREKVLSLDEESQKKEYFQFGTSNKKMSESISHITGIETEGWPIKMQGNHLVHIEKRHGAMGKADMSMADPNDFSRIGFALNNYDEIKQLPDNEGYRGKDNKPAKQIEFRTRINGTMAIQTVVPDTKRKTLFITSARIEKRKDEHL